MCQTCDEVKPDAEMFASWGVGYRPKDRRRAAADSAGTHHSRGEYKGCSAGIFQDLGASVHVGGLLVRSRSDRRATNSWQKACGLCPGKNVDRCKTVTALFDTLIKGSNNG